MDLNGEKRECHPCRFGEFPQAGNSGLKQNKHVWACRHPSTCHVCKWCVRGSCMFDQWWSRNKCLVRGDKITSVLTHLPSERGATRSMVAFQTRRSHLEAQRHKNSTRERSVQWGRRCRRWASFEHRCCRLGNSCLRRQTIMLLPLDAKHQIIIGCHRSSFIWYLLLLLWSDHEIASLFCNSAPSLCVFRSSLWPLHFAQQQHGNPAPLWAHPIKLH